MPGPQCTPASLESRGWGGPCLFSMMAPTSQAEALSLTLPGTEGHAAAQALSESVCSFPVRSSDCTRPHWRQIMHTGHSCVRKSFTDSSLWLRLEALVTPALCRSPDHRAPPTRCEPNSQNSGFKFPARNEYKARKGSISLKHSSPEAAPPLKQRLSLCQDFSEPHRPGVTDPLLTSRPQFHGPSALCGVPYSPVSQTLQRAGCRGSGQKGGGGAYWPRPVSWPCPSVPARSFSSLTCPRLTSCTAAPPRFFPQVLLTPPIHTVP